MKTKSWYASFFLPFLLICGCSEIFEEDINNKEIVVLAPFDGFISSTGDILFWWDPLDGASAYELQIVSPGFDSIRNLVVDTFITINKTSLSFDVGRYEWSLRGVNSGYSTAYYVGTFQVSNSEGIDKPTLTKPLKNSIITILPFRFEWKRNAQNVVGDSLYIFNSTSEILSGYPVYTVQTSIQIGGLEDGQYFWAVKSVDSFGRVSTIEPGDKARFEIDLE